MNNNPDKSILVVHLMGRREETCPEFLKRTSCSQCSYAMSRSDPPKWTENISGIIDCEAAKEFISDHAACVRSLLWTLADRAGIIVMPKIVFINEYTRLMLPQEFDLLLDDEGDTFADTLFNETFSSLQIARSRTNKRHFNLTGCTQKCAICVLDYASSVQGLAIDCTRSVPTLDQEMNDPAKLIHFLQDCADDCEQQTEAGIIKPAFDFQAIRRNIQQLENVLQKPEKYIESKEQSITPSQHLIRERLSLLGETWTGDPKKDKDKLQELESEAWSGGTQAFPTISLEPTVTDESIFNWECPDLPRTGDTDDEYRLNTLLLKNLFINPNGYKTWNKLTWEHKVPLRAFIDFAIFCHRVGRTRDRQALLCHLPRSGNHQPHCEIKIIALDVDRFISTIQRLTAQKTILLSGTFLNARMSAASLLVPEDEVQFIDHSVPLHNQAVIINHNHRLGSELPTSQRFNNPAIPKAFDHKELCVFLATIFIQRENLNTNVLMFLPTKKQAKQFFQHAKSFPELRGIGIYHMTARDEVITSKKNIRIFNTEDMSDDGIYINHYRSADSRGTNLPQFDVGIGFGGGLPNFFTFHALQKAIAEEITIPISLEELINYNRVRVVAQALLRLPRDGDKFRVLIYFGDMQPWDVPVFIRNRLVNAALLYQDLEGGEGNPFSTRTKNKLARSQAERLGDVVGQLLVNGQGALDPYLSESSQAEETSRPVVNHPEFTAERWRHVQDVITQKGCLHRRDDGTVGAIKGWLAFLEHLVAIGVLQDSKAGQKKVLIPGPAYPDDDKPEVVRE